MSIRNYAEAMIEEEMKKVSEDLTILEREIEEHKITFQEAKVTLHHDTIAVELDEAWKGKVVTTDHLYVTCGDYVKVLSRELQVVKKCQLEGRLKEVIDDKLFVLPIIEDDDDFLFEKTVVTC